MKTNLFKSALVVLLVLLTAPSQANTYPPDNAALIYYQAALAFKGDQANDEAVSDYLEGKTELTDEVAAYVQSKKYLMKLLTDTSELGYCEWGMDYSDSVNCFPPPISELRRLATIILAKGKILAGEGDYQLAFEQCLIVHRIARHMDQNHGNAISNLVGIVIARRANETIEQLLSTVPPDENLLGWLKEELSQLPSLSIKATIIFECEYFRSQMTKDVVEKWMATEYFINWDSPISDIVKERIARADDQFYQRNRQYNQNHQEQVVLALELPYSKAYTALDDLGKKIFNDAKTNPDATLTAVFTPAFNNMYHYEYRGNTLMNAIKTAVEIYLVKARTGSLPDQLSPGSPKDLFSGQDFEYEKIADGFILRCRSKDLKDDTIREYAFGVK